jgi:hypothetical protein
VIRVWLSRRRTAGVHRSVDEVTFLGAQFDVRDAQIEGLRDALAEAVKKLAEERSAHAVEAARLRYALAQAVRHAGLDRYLRQGVEQARRLAEEPTAHVTREQLARSRPMDAPTEQWRTR